MLIMFSVFLNIFITNIHFERGIFPKNSTLFKKLQNSPKIRFAHILDDLHCVLFMQSYGFIESGKLAESQTGLPNWILSEWF